MRGSAFPGLSGNTGQGRRGLSGKREEGFVSISETEARIVRLIARGQDVSTIPEELGLEPREVEETLQGLVTRLRATVPSRNATGAPRD